MQVWKDIRRAFRGMMERPAISALAVLSLGLGIAASAAVLSVAYPALFLPLPFEEPHRLVTVLCRWEGTDTIFSDAEVLYLRQRSTAFSEVAVRTPWNAPLAGDRSRRPVSALKVSSNYFRTLRTQPALGRAFIEGEGEYGGQQAAVLSDWLWQTRFGGDPEILGRSVEVGEGRYNVVGVMAPSIIDRGTALWVTAHLDANYSDRGRWPVLARLRDGVLLEEARQETSLLHEQFLQDYKPYYQGTAAVEALRDSFLDGNKWYGGEPVRARLYAVLGLLGFLLLMGCANVSNLLLIRAHTRQQEIAIRRALGAGRGRIAAQLLSEGLAFAAAAGAAGLALALATRGVLRSLGEGLALPQSAGAEPAFLLFGIGLTLLCSLLGGLAPALAAARFSVSSQGFAAGESVADRLTVRTTGRFSRAFIFIQVALSAVLLSGAAMTLKSVAALFSVDFGFQTENLLKVDLSLPAGRYSQRAPDEPGAKASVTGYYTIRAEMELFFRQAASSLGALPGVPSVAATGLFDSRGCKSWFVLPGQPPFDIRQAPSVDSPQAQLACIRPVNNDYFAALQIPLLRGRPFGEQDSASGPGVAIINQAMARRFWPQEDPIGKRIGILSGQLRDQTVQWREILAVVGDTRHSRSEKSPPRMVYIPYSQLPTGPQLRHVTRFKQTFLLRHPPGNPPKVEWIAEAIGELDPDVTLLEAGSLQAALDGPYAQTRFYTRLMALLAGMGLLLALTGIYGVTAFAVRLRSAEICIRKAVGARLEDVLRLVVGQSLVTILAGLGAGLAVSLALAQTLSSLLLGVEAEGYLPLAAAALVLLVALAASLLPAWRGYRVNPADLLRYL